MNLTFLTAFVAFVCLADLTVSLKCRSCEGMQCDFDDDWKVESCSDQREQECYTLTRPEGDGKTYRMGCTHHSCRHLRDGREVKCTKCDRKNYCNEESAIGVGVRSTGGGGSNRGSSGGGGSEGRGLDGNEFGSGGGSNRNGGTGGGGSQRQTGGGSDGFGQRSSDGFGSGADSSSGFGQQSGGGGSAGRGQQPVPMGSGVGGGSNQFGGTGGGGSGNGGGMSTAQWSHQRDHGQYQSVADTEDVYQQSHSGTIGSRFCYTCRGEQCRNKANMNRQLCKEDKYETCYAVHDARNGTTHEMGCTHYTCTLLKAYVDSNVCEKCTGDFCNHKMWKYREMGGGNGMDDDYYFF